MSCNNLYFLDKPVCKQTQRFLFGVAKREAIQVPCSVEADPEEGITFRWAFNNSYNLQPIAFQQPIVTAPMTSIATYMPRNKYGFGQLLCWAKNRLGKKMTLSLILFYNNILLMF